MIDDKQNHQNLISEENFGPLKLQECLTSSRTL